MGEEIAILACGGRKLFSSRFLLELFFEFSDLSEEEIGENNNNNTIDFSKDGSTE